MSDTITCVEDSDRKSYPIYGPGLGCLEPLIGFNGQSYDVIPAVEDASVFIAFDGKGDRVQKRSNFVLDEYRSGVKVGPASFRRLVAGSTSDDFDADLICALGTSTVQVRGQCDRPPCFATGTLISTPDDTMPVEALSTGQIIALADGRCAPIRWIGHRCQFDADVIRFGRGSLGGDTPRRDLFVSSDHGIFIDGALVQAGLLVNGETIIRERRDEVVFWHVELDHHAILLAEGAAAESYLDIGNRRQFANCPLLYVPEHLIFKQCAEWVFASERLDVIRASLSVTA